MSVCPLLARVGREGPSDPGWGRRPVQASTAPNATTEEKCNGGEVHLVQGKERVTRDIAEQRMKQTLGTETLTPHFARLARWDPEYLEAYRQFIFEATDAREGALSRKTKELIILALAASDLNLRGTKTHIKNALAHGATPREVLEVLEVAVPRGGVITVLYGSEVLEEVLQEMGMSFEG